MEEEFKEFNLTAPQGTIITYLFKYGDLRIIDLSEKMRISSSTISGIVDRLEDHGYVDRNRNENNRREVRISLNDKFKEKLKKHILDRKKSYSNLMTAVSEKELEEIYISLKKLENILKNSSEFNSEIKGEKNAETGKIS